jgi:hypothetical protein
MEFTELYKELKSMERRVIVKRHHIQKYRLETDEGEFQSGE